MKYIPYARQSITEEDIKAVTSVLRSDWLTTGPTVQVFEHNVAAYCGARFATAVNSATSALHIACLTAGLGPGDELWTSPNSFVASANAALYCGATVDFVDIDSRTYNMDIEQLAAKLAEASIRGNLPKVVVPVHFAGQPCEMAEIWALAARYGFTVIEDAAHAIGAVYDDAKVGSCRYAHMTVFSFHPVKIITTGEGGMVVTNDAGMQEKLCRLRSHGITRDPQQMLGDAHGEWYYQQLELGYNFRMTDLQAVLGDSQVKRIDKFLGKREKVAGRYDSELQNLPLILPYQHPRGKSSWHLYVVCIDTAKTDKTRRMVFDALRKKGIGVNVHYIPVHTQPYYQKRFRFAPGAFPRSERYYDTCLSLPMYYELTNEEQTYVIECIKEVIT